MIHRPTTLIATGEFYRHRNMKIVMANGCFDLLHRGHIEHLRAAKALGDVLVVLITADMYIDKGNGRPVIDEYSRAVMVSELRCVDHVVINNYSTATQAIKHLRPDIYVKGAEYKNNITDKLREEINALEEGGGVIAWTDTPQIHTQDIINKIKNSTN